MIFHALRMRAGIKVEVRREDRRRLDRIVGDRNTPQKHAARARVILATADGCGTLEIMRRSGLSKPVVWRWQERFMREGVDGLLRDRTRRPGKAPLAADIVKRIVDLTLAEPPGETTHCTGRAMAEAVGVSLRSVQRVWTAHGLAPHRERTFKLSKDKRFVEKFADVVGLYIDPPAHAIVPSTTLADFFEAAPFGDSFLSACVIHRGSASWRADHGWVVEERSRDLAGAVSGAAGT